MKKGVGPFCRALSISALLFLSLLNPSSLLAKVPSDCASFFEQKSLTIGTFNVLQLRNVKRHSSYTESLTDTFKNLDLDIYVLQEVTDAGVLMDLVKDHLNDRYEIFIPTLQEIESEIHVAFLVKKSLPFSYTLEAHGHETWIDPTTKKEEILLNRGLPSLFVRPKINANHRAKEQADPLLILMGTHFKSKRDRENDPESQIMRTEQVKRASEMIQKYQYQYNKTPIMLAGDFNGSVNFSSEYLPLWRSAHLVNSFDASDESPSREARITHSYFERRKRFYNEIDAILISKKFSHLIKETQVYRYYRTNGKEKPLPKTFKERNQNPSDHFPVFTILDLKAILGDHSKK